VRRALALVLLLLLLAGARALAGSEDAMGLVDEGDAAMKDKSYAAAEKFYRRALDAMDDCLPAQEGLGEALLAQEKTSDAIVAFRRVVREAHASDAVPTSWDVFVERAEHRLGDLDDHGRELQGLVDEHVRALVKLAVKVRGKDPDLADRALDLALTLDPDDARARELRGRMAEKGTRREAVFDGEQIADWDGGRSKWWSVEDGAIVAETRGVATYIRTQKEVRGNFDVIMEARIAKVYDAPPSSPSWARGRRTPTTPASASSGTP
jgi:tetratricopeptide (TPR) repeat protein